IRIGARSNVQEACVLHTDIGFPLAIGADCTIGHRAMLHGCTIEDGALVGMGATILNGARIGRGCLIGACALVTEGKVIPDGSLVMGAPGRVVRLLDDAERARLIGSAAWYVENAARHRTGLRAV
ncbi:MAG: gamma carbonic anhydrase family protein, partial [Gemmobacter sp.]